MREVERRAKLAGGRVWVLIRRRSRQGDAGEGGSDDDLNLDDDNNDDGDPAPNGTARGTESNGAMPAAGDDARAASTSAGSEVINAPDWVLSRLERMRHRGSFLDGDELLFPVRNSGIALGQAAAASLSSAVAPSVETVGGGNGNGNGNDNIVGGDSSGTANDQTASGATEFPLGDLLQLVRSEGSGNDRRDTDEALVVLREAMEQHSAALVRLAGWMAPTTTTPYDDSIDDMSPKDPKRTRVSPVEESPAQLAPASPTAVDGVPSDGAIAEAIAPSPSMRHKASGGGSDDVGGDDSGGISGGDREEDGVRAMLELSRSLDVMEGRVRRERYKAHRAADEEIHRTPGLYKEACALGNAWILRGHDYLSQVRMVFAVGGVVRVFLFDEVSCDTVDVEAAICLLFSSNFLYLVYLRII